MSYCAENRLPRTVSVNRLLELVQLLGFQKTGDAFRTKEQIGSFVWLGDKEQISFVGVELSIYKQADCISVQTRTRAGRSYWDLNW